jgi:hypothetical protein
MKLTNPPARSSAGLALRSLARRVARPTSPALAAVFLAGTLAIGALSPLTAQQAGSGDWT